MNVSHQKILITGGTGLIGQHLAVVLKKHIADVRILSRNPRNPNEFHWDPKKKQIDPNALNEVSVLINLSGAGIADGRWTEDRKRELENSRVDANNFLFSLLDDMPHLKHFISASGINAYTPDLEIVYEEDAPYGKEFLCRLTQKWEESALQFSSRVKVSIIRTAVVLSSKGGAYPKLSKITKLGLGSGLGSGKQSMPWIHIADLSAIYLHVIEKELNGTYNAVADCPTNKDFMRRMAKCLRKPFFLPNVPAWVMKLLLGEMSTMLLEGVRASNEKLIRTGFTFHYPELDEAFSQLSKGSE